MTLSPLNYFLNIATNSSGAVIQNCYVFSYAQSANLEYTSGALGCAIPEIVDKSPLIIVVEGVENSSHFQQWVSYPEVPFTSGSTFQGSAQNVFSYDVTINGVLYKLDDKFRRSAS